jgi:hypothetical protein
MVGKVFKPRQAKNPVERRRTSFDAVEDFTPGAPVFLLSQHDGKCTQRSRRIGAKTGRRWRQVKATVSVFGEDTYAG